MAPHGRGGFLLGDIVRGATLGDLKAKGIAGIHVVKNKRSDELQAALVIDAADVTGNKLCSDFGKMKCSKIGNNQIIVSLTFFVQINSSLVYKIYAPARTP